MTDTDPRNPHGSADVDARLVETRFCRDCRHARRGFWGGLTALGSYRYARCGRTPIARCDALVEGGTDSLLFCSTNRSRSGDCGPSGKMWEPKR